MFFKKTIVLAAAGAFLAACRHGGYTVEGACSGLSDGDTLLVCEAGDWNVCLDTAIVSDGKFYFEGAADSMSLCVVRSLGQRNCSMPFVLENGKIKIALSDKPMQSKVSGTRNNAKWQLLMDATALYGLKIDAFASSLYNADLSHGERMALIDSIAVQDSLFGETVTTFIRKESDSDFGRFMLVYFSDFMKPSEIEETVAAMPKKSQAHPEVRALLAKIKGKGRR